MKNVAISAVLAFAIGLLPLGTRPAHALSDKELLALLAGAAAIAVISKELKDKRNEASRVPVTSQYGRHGQNYRYGKDRKKSRTLPAECIRMIDRPGRKDRQVLGARCLERNDVRIGRLPQECLISVRTDRGFRDAYGSRCVQRAGWTIEDTRRWKR